MIEPKERDEIAERLRLNSLSPERQRA
jgi:hypothetical protein